MSFKTLWHQQQYNGESIVTAYQHICSHQIEKWRALTPVYCPSLGHLLSPSPSLFVLYIFKCFHCSLPTIKRKCWYVCSCLFDAQHVNIHFLDETTIFPIFSLHIATMRWSFFLTVNSELTQTGLVGQVRSMRGVVMSDEYSSARLLIWTCQPTTKSTWAVLVSHSTIF